MSENERWQRIEEAFAAAVELSPEERGKFLSVLRRQGEGVAVEVESLLRADGSAQGFLQKPLLPTAVRAEASRFEPAAVELPIPERIGPYRILLRLGSGGMSQVFLGERIGGNFSPRVAIKLIRAEIVSAELVRRFETERQILSQLAHPHIASLLDGGQTGSGLPYLVMEYVEGVEIDEYCDRERLTIDERLALFLPVCSAVQYAHQNLIVHRDIKVGNILVGQDGMPKLLDFGIAKLLSPELFPVPVERTATRLRPMTPYYASPEQIRNGQISVATDVYSLGVLLYRLLTSRFPYDFEDHQPRAIEERILEQPMVPPAEAVEVGETSIDELAEARSMSKSSLQRALAGDTALILGMALRKEAERRYETVEQLAGDVRGVMIGLPIAAHGDAVWYRIHKFLGRNRMATGLAAAIALLLVALALSMTLQARRIVRERDLVARQRERVEEAIESLDGAENGQEASALPDGEPER